MHFNFSADTWADRQFESIYWQMSGGEIQALCLGKKSRDTDGDTLNDTAMLLVGVLVTYDTDAYIIL